MYSHTPKLTTNNRLSAVVHVRSFLVTRDLNSSTPQGAPFFNLAAGEPRQKTLLLSIILVV